MTETSKSMRTFYVVWLGQLLSTLGSSMTAFAIAVWIFDQNQNATPFILTSFFDNLPYVLIATYAGTIVDKYDRRIIMLIADVISALVTVVALFLFISGLLQIWHIWAIAVVASVTRAFQEPAWMAAIPQLVPKDQLPRAAGLGQLSHALSMLGAPALAGVLYVAVGLRGVIFVDLFTFAIAFTSLLFVRFPSLAADGAADDDAETTFWGKMTFGYRYLRGIPGLFYLMIVFAMVNFAASAGSAVSGPLVLTIGSAQDLGWVQTALGLGLLIGSLIASSVSYPANGKIRLTFLCISGLGIGFIVAGATPRIGIIAFGFFLAVLLIPMASSISQVIHQTRVPPKALGRTFAFSGMVSRILMPLSYLIAGPLIDNVFEPAMQSGGLLYESAIADVMGNGVGRGSGLFMILMGSLLLIVLAIGYLNPRIRNLEHEVPELA